ncbi:TolC family protein [bacterium]|nr:TolC family protein [bacterium]
MKPRVFILAAAFALALPANAFAQSFTLDDAIAHALENNKRLAAAREEIEAAEARLSGAWAPIYPRVDIEAGYTHISDVPTIDIEGLDLSALSAFPGAPEIPPFEEHKKMGDEDNYRAEVKARQLLFGSGQALAGMRAAKAATRAAREQVAADENEIARDVALAFYNVLLAREVLVARQEALSTSEAHLADVRTRLSFGAATRLELLQSELDASNRRPEVREAQNALAIATTGFKSLIGYDLDAPIAIDGDLGDLAPVPAYPEAFATATSHRPELAALSAGIDARDHEAWARTAGMLPKVVALGSYGYQKPWYFEEDWKTVWTVGVGVTIPVFDGFAAWSGRKEALAGMRKLEKERAAAREGIDLQVRRALLDLSEIEPRVRETAENLARAKEIHEIAAASYKLGAITNLELLDAQLAVTAAATARAKALFDYQTARVRLISASGAPLTKEATP